MLGLYSQKLNALMAALRVRSHVTGISRKLKAIDKRARKRAKALNDHLASFTSNPCMSPMTGKNSTAEASSELWSRICVLNGKGSKQSYGHAPIDFSTLATYSDENLAEKIENMLQSLDEALMGTAEYVENGKRLVSYHCPSCSHAILGANVASMSGSGKRCPKCKTKVKRFGTEYRVVE